MLQSKSSRILTSLIQSARDIQHGTPITASFHFQKQWLSNSSTTKDISSSPKATEPNSPLKTATAKTSPIRSWASDARSIPSVPWQLGIAGALPFLALTPPVMKQLGNMFLFIPPALVANSATYQVGYGACILSFLGAVHWGVAMTSNLPGPVGHVLNNERYMWGVVPSLMAWPLLMLDPGPASLALSVMLTFVYYQDQNMGRRGLLPLWYTTLRTPLTLLATMGTCTTAAYYMHLTLDKIAKETEKRPHVVTEQH